MTINKDDAQKALMLLLIFSIMLGLKIKGNGLQSVEISNLLTFCFVIIMAITLMYYAIITKDKFMRVVYLVSIIPFALDLPLFQFLGIQFVTICIIIFVMVLMSLLLRCIMRFIESN